MITLYQYLHCPFCIRVHMILARKSLPYQTETLLYDDSETPINLVGNKQCPILVIPGELPIKESMDIIARLESNYPPELLHKKTMPKEIKSALSAFRQTSNQLIKPRIIYSSAPEFATESARDYYRSKYEARWEKSFAQCVRESTEMLPIMQAAVNTLDKAIADNQSLLSEFSSVDLQLFPAIYCITVVDGLVFPKHLSTYLQQQASAARMTLLEPVVLPSSHT